MTIFIGFNNLRHGRACPGHPALARIPCVGRRSAFFRTLLSSRRPVEKTRPLHGTAPVNGIGWRSQRSPPSDFISAEQYGAIGIESQGILRCRFSFLFLMGLCGGLVSLATLVIHRYVPLFLGPKFAATARLSVPYGAAIAGGGIIVTLLFQSSFIG